VGRCTTASLTHLRRLRVFALDPSLALRLDTVSINAIVIRVPWESDPSTGRLLPGPIGEYFIKRVTVDPEDRFFDYEVLDKF